MTQHLEAVQYAAGICCETRVEVKLFLYGGSRSRQLQNLLVDFALTEVPAIANYEYLMFLQLK